MTIDEQPTPLQPFPWTFISFSCANRKQNFLVHNRKKHTDWRLYGTPEVVMFTDRYRLFIGEFCSIVWNVRILVDANHPTDWVST